MAKELVTHLKPVITDSINNIILSDPSFTSVTTLYDSKVNGMLIANKTANLAYPVSDFDGLLIESMAYNDQSGNYIINPTYIVKPSVGDAKLNPGYILDIRYDPSVYQSIFVSFLTDTTVSVTVAANTGSVLKPSIRNIYGVTNKAISTNKIYSTSPTSIGTWIDGKTIYRQIIDLGLMSLPIGLTTIPHNISGIDMLVNFEVTYRRIDSLENMGKFPYIGHNSSTNAIMYSFAQATPTDIRITTNIERPNYKMTALMEYTRKE